MPSATSYGQYVVPPKPCRPSLMNPPPPKLELYSVDLATWDDGEWSDPLFTEGEPDDLDEPWPYRFKSGERVWICASDGHWYRGKVVSQAMQGSRRSGYLSREDCLFWCVEYHMSNNRVRKWFAPLNGEIKPDIPHTHKLLELAGWLDSDEEL